MQGWISGVARNVALESLQKRPDIEGSTLTRDIKDTRGGGDGPGPCFADLRLNELTDRQRAAVYARLAGRSIARIAERLGILWQGPSDLVQRGIRRGAPRRRSIGPPEE